MFSLVFYYTESFMRRQEVVPLREKKTIYLCRYFLYNITLAYLISFLVSSLKFILNFNLNHIPYTEPSDDKNK